ncbi:hypothetical protein BD309DRAFT_909808 [Dichomitus squalens]|nr:hypothetical protein BD309DRAFT_909808 [Dichomitus squalens]
MDKQGNARVELRAVDTDALALNTSLYYAADFSYIALDIALSSALFGILTSLVAVAVTILIRRGLGHRPVKFLLAATLILYGSTTVYMASLASYVTSVHSLVLHATLGISSESYANETRVFRDGILRQSWMITISLMTNIATGDSIVWWRAYSVWRSRVVCAIGVLLIALMLGLGVTVLSSVHHCIEPCKQPELLFPKGFLGDACAGTSLLLNIAATCLIGYKAWEHKRFLREHLGAGKRRTRMMRVLALLVESGSVYCLLLLVVLVYEATPALTLSPDVHQSGFFNAIAYYTYACFIPVMAIYPVLIIIIVTLNWSPIQYSLTDLNIPVDPFTSPFPPSVHDAVT